MPTYRCKDCLTIEEQALELFHLSHSYTSQSTEVWFTINFASCLTIGKAHGWGTFQKCGAGLSYPLV
jgi:hypothetical protein